MSGMLQGWMGPVTLPARPHGMGGETPAHVGSTPGPPGNGLVERCGMLREALGSGVRWEVGCCGTCGAVGSRMLKDVVPCGMWGAVDSKVLRAIGYCGLWDALGCGILQDAVE